MIKYVKIEYIGKPIQVFFLRTKHPFACLLGRTDVMNSYTPTKASMKRLHDVLVRRAEGLMYAVTTIYPIKDDHEK